MDGLVPEVSQWNIPPALRQTKAGKNKDEWPYAGGAPRGNNNAGRGRVWKQAILNALSKKSRFGRMAALEALADRLIELAYAGEIPALKELGDRLEGKPPQAIVGDPDNPIIHKHVRDMTDEELESLARDLPLRPRGLTYEHGEGEDDE